MRGRSRHVLTRRDFIRGLLAAGLVSPGRQLWPSSAPIVDRSNPLAYGLTGAYLPGRGGRNLYDVNGNGSSPICGTSYAAKPTQEGFALDTSAQGGGQGCNAVASPAQQPVASASLFWRGILLGTPASNEYLFGVEFQDGSSSPFDAYDLVYSSGGGLEANISTTTGGTFSSSVWAAPTNTIIDAALAYTLGGSAFFYGNGLQQGASLGTTGTIINYGTNPQFEIGSTNSASQNAANARHLVGFTWNRQLSAAEVLSLHQRPYQLFLWPEDQVWR